MTDSTAAPSRGSLFLVFLVVFIDLLGFGIVLPLLPRYAAWFNATKLDQILLMASFSAMQFLFAPLWGRASDRVGRRPILIIGLLGSVVFYSLFGLASSLKPDGRLVGLLPLAWLLIARIGAGISGGTITVAQAYIADVTDEKNRGKGMALIGVAFGLGFMLGPLLGAAFTSNDPQAPPNPATGYLAAGLSGLALLGAIFKLPESLNPSRLSKHRSWIHLESLAKAARSPVHAGIIGGIFLATFAFAQFESTLSLYTRSLGFSDRRNFWVFAYIGFVLIIMQGMVVRRMFNYVREKPMAIAGAVLLAIGQCLLAYSASRAPEAAAAGSATGTAELLQLFVILPVTIAGFSAVNPALQSLLSLNTAADEQGEMLGLGQSISAFARIVGPGLGIWLFYRSPQLTYWSAAALMLAAAAWIASLKPAEKPAAAD